MCLGGCCTEIYIQHIFLIFISSFVLEHLNLCGPHRRPCCMSSAHRWSRSSPTHRLAAPCRHPSSTLSPDFPQLLPAASGCRAKGKLPLWNGCDVSFFFWQRFEEGMPNPCSASTLLGCASRLVAIQIVSVHFTCMRSAWRCLLLPSGFFKCLLHTSIYSLGVYHTSSSCRWPTSGFWPLPQVKQT